MIDLETAQRHAAAVAKAGSEFNAAINAASKAGLHVTATLVEMNHAQVDGTTTYITVKSVISPTLIGEPVETKDG